MTTLQAPAKTRPAISCGMCLLLLVITVTIVNKPALVKADVPSPPTTLALYVHEDRLPPNATAVISASPSGVYDGSVREFGEIVVVDNVVREGQAADSTILGRAVGQVTFAKDLSLYFNLVFNLNTPSGTGSITAQGLTDSLANGEVAITGGTGDFRWARGYADFLLISNQNMADVVLLNTLYLKYD